MSAVPPADHQQPLDRHLDDLQEQLPERYARWLQRLRTPAARWIRVPAGLLLIAGGFLGFLPILGFWMLPLGLLLLAIDIPLLRTPTGWLIERVRRLIGR